MSTEREHLDAIETERLRGMSLHTTRHTAQHAAAEILRHAMDLHELAHGRHRAELPDTEPKLLTQTAALCLRRLAEADLHFWHKSSDPTPGASHSASSPKT